ncbi:KAP family NTPase [Methanobrevibacter sp. TMH8]|uniref:KAP family P-loop NTPase fold protein n=1 Tax=Methanobrevibacter sp. TMH8 TaxID=2848611 RepID=UPI001CC96216|nr:KAP family NTPase [Methanobrevibacter sp. TMH8]
MSNDFINDISINKKEEDGLHRVKYVEQLSSKIFNYKNKKSLVIGLSGEWGSGKTSMLNMVIETFEKKYPNELILIEFNPWYFSNQKELIDEFFKAIMISLSENKGVLNKINENDLINSFKDYYNSLIDKSTVSSILSLNENEFIKNSIKSLPYILPKFNNFIDAYNSDKSLTELKEKINNYIEKEKLRILFIIDDIDRLSDIETEQIFKLVKLVADFNRTIYLMAYDKEIVSKSLNKTQHDKGHQYLEKIIQIPLDIPKISKNDLNKILYKRINPIIPLNEDHFIYVEHYMEFKSFFRNVRDVNRYCDVLNFDFGNVNGEVNSYDFMLLTAIKVFEPNVFENIIENKRFLLETSVLYTRKSQKDDIEEKKEFVNKDIIKNLKHVSHDNMYSLIKLLFPQLNRGYSGIQWERIWDRELKICSFKHFDKYFELNIPEDELSNEDFNKIISLKVSKEGFKDKLVELYKSNKLFLFLNKFESYIYNNKEINFDNSEFQNILTSLFEIGDYIFQKDNYSYDFVGIILYLLMLLDNNEIRFKILENSFEDSKNSIITFSIFINGLYRENEKERDNFLSSEQLDYLRHLAIDGMKCFDENNDIINDNNLDSILNIWLSLDKESAIDFINSNDESDKGLINIISSFASNSTKHFGIEYNGSFYKFDESINNYLEKSKYEKRIKDILSNNKNINEKTKFALKKFIGILE